MYQYPQIPWIVYAQGPGGLHARCNACGATAGPLAGPQLHQFAAGHREHRSAAPTHYGAGDAVAALTHAVGITPCTPCERRRQQLNGWLPRLFRR